MKGQLNPKLEVGDRVMCYHMEGEINVTPGTIGIVTKVSKDPFEDDGEIYSVSWDNGSTLGLVSVTDAWKKIPKEL